MVTFIEEEEEAQGEVEEEGNGRMKDYLREKQTEDLEGFPHGNGRGNGRGFHSQAPSERDQRDRQEEEWSIPASVGGRGRDIPVEWESPHRTPPTPSPSEDRFFTDWSSLGSGSPL